MEIFKRKYNEKRLTTMHERTLIESVRVLQTLKPFTKNLEKDFFKI